MDMGIVLTIIGSFMSLLLMVNAFFTRKTLEKITDIELKLAVIITKHDATEERSKLNVIKMEALESRVSSLEARVNI